MHVELHGKLMMAMSPVNEGPVIFSQIAREDQGCLKIVVKLHLLAEPFDDIRHLIPSFLQQILMSCAELGQAAGSACPAHEIC